MLAMDVVDTLRHRERVVERALTADDRDRELVGRLQEIYASQGIDVSKAIIERGVEDLRADRFVYTPTPPSFGRTLAKLYVSRGSWGKPLGLFVTLAALALVGYQVIVRGPEQDCLCCRGRSGGGARDRRRSRGSADRWRTCARASGLRGLAQGDRGA
jgi:hypothetical protein